MHSFTKSIIDYFICLIVASTILLSGGCSNNKEYNLVLISIDTLRADHLGCYGYRRDTSPNIDAFARQHMVFDNFFTVVPKTGPSMTSLFTGKYMQHHGVVDNNYLRYPDATSFVQALSPEYQTAAFVANPTLSAKRKYDTGFASYQVATPNNNMGAWGQEDISPKAINWLESARNKGNFFLWLHYIDPHGPYTPPKEYRDLFMKDPLYKGDRKVKLDYTPVPGINENYILGAVPKYQRLGDHDIVDYYIAEYDAEIRYTDYEVGRVLDYLKASNLLDNTIVIITADHGESLGENDYYFEHGLLVNEGSIHIPLIISHPKMKEPLRFKALMENIDIAPTLLSILGHSPLNDIDGIDFSGLILGKNANGQLRKFTYSCTPYGYTDFYETIREPPTKIVRLNERDLRVYDLQTDPQETIDLSKKTGPLQFEKQIGYLTNWGKETKQPIQKEAPLDKDTATKLRTLGYTH